MLRGENTHFFCCIKMSESELQPGPSYQRSNNTWAAKCKIENVDLARRTNTAGREQWRDLVADRKTSSIIPLGRLPLSRGEENSPFLFSNRYYEGMKKVISNYVDMKISLVSQKINLFLFKILGGGRGRGMKYRPVYWLATSDHIENLPFKNWCIHFVVILEMKIWN